MENQSLTDNWPYYGFHRCEQSTKGGQDVSYGRSDSDEESRWCLRLYHSATEDDLENGIADLVGETLNYREVAIAFCPFCGKNLEEDSRKMGVPLNIGW